MTGQVRDERGEKPVEGVALTLAAAESGPSKRLSARSAPDGTFAFDDVPDFPAWTLSAPVPGGGTAEITGLAVRPGETTDAGVLCLAVPVSVSGVVLDPDGKPVRGAKVRALRPFDLTSNLIGVFAEQGAPPELVSVAEAVSGDDGRFALKRVPFGLHDLAADARTDHRMFARAVHRVEVRAGAAPPDVTIRLEEGFGIRGSVTRGGVGVAGARIHVSPEADGPAGLAKLFARVQSATTAADGTYEVAHLSAGDWNVALQLDGEVAPGKSSVTFPGHEGTLDFALEGDAEMTGRVTSADGKAVAGATVTVSETGTGRKGSASSDAAGAYRIRGLASGVTVGISATASGHAPFGASVLGELGFFGGGAKSVTTETTPGVNVFDIAFPEGATLRGRVVARGTQDGIPSARVKVASGGIFGLGHSTEGVTDAQGRVEIRGIATGPARISIEKRGWYAEGDESSSGLGAFLAVAQAIGGAKGEPKDDPGTGLDIQAAPGRVIERTVELDRAAIVTGRVTGPGNLPVEGATVEIAPVKSGLAAFEMEEMLGGMMGSVKSGGLVTGKDGTFTAEAAPGRDFRVKATKTGLISAESEKLRADPGVTAPSVELVLRAGGVVEGVVLSGGKGVEGAEIRWMSPETGGGNPIAAMLGGSDLDGSEPHARTDAEGRYRMTGVRPGKVILRAKREGFRPFTKTGVEVADEQTSAFDIVLDAGETIEGVVVDDRGAQVRGAKLTFTPFKSSARAIFGGGSGDTVRATSDDTGAFRAAGLAAGEHRVEVEAADLLPPRELRCATGGGPVRVVMIVPRTITAVVHADGKPVRGASVTATPAGSAESGGVMRIGGVEFPRPAAAGEVDAVTDGDGRAVLRGLHPGKYRVTAAAAESGSDAVARNVVTTKVEDVPAEGQELRIDCAVGHRLVVRVTGPDGKPMAANVSGVRTSDQKTTPAVDTAGGAAELRGLDPGEYRISVSAQRHRTEHVVASSGAGEIAVRLTAAGALKGRVLGTTGKPVGFATLHLTAESGEETTDSYFDRGGRFELDTVPPGAGRLVVTSDQRGRRLRAEVTWSVAGGQTADLGDIRLVDAGPAGQEK
ncbi:MAG: hypothetical protein HMLKMBBP_01428 [Planctomycetes bacterium]|nr:hypothetical protein [Planctomycetota bacterium]